MSAEMANEIKLISGRSHPELSENIAKRYATHTPPPLISNRYVSKYRTNGRERGLAMNLTPRGPTYSG